MVSVLLLERPYNTFDEDEGFLRLRVESLLQSFQFDLPDPMLTRIKCSILPLKLRTDLKQKVPKDEQHQVSTSGAI